MIRLIKRYGSRKLYDTEESRYVSLDELAGWIRTGQQIRVIDNKTADDVTSQTLTQIISEEGRKGTALLPNELLHELIRIGEQAVSTGREEMARLRERLEDLESSLAAIDSVREDKGDSSSGPKESP
jgi:polyhydroxyalkanoate synthesis repressor PhaR